MRGEREAGREAKTYGGERRSFFSFRGKRASSFLEGGFGRGLLANPIPRDNERDSSGSGGELELGVGDGRFALSPIAASAPVFEFAPPNKHFSLKTPSQSNFVFSHFFFHAEPNK